MKKYCGVWLLFMIIYPSVDFTYANTLDKDSSEEVERTEKLSKIDKSL